MIKRLILLSVMGFLSITCVNAYELTGDNLIEPRYYEGNLLIYNEGYVTYSIYADGFYLGTINHDQGMYVNETFDYKLYALTNPVSDITVGNVEKKINQYWYIGLICLIVLLFFIAGLRIILKNG